MDPNNFKRDETLVYFKNPLKTDVVLEERDDSNKLVIYTIPALQIVHYPKYLADILKKHLIDAIINTRAMGFVTPERRQELEQEVEVDLGGS